MSIQIPERRDYKLMFAQTATMTAPVPIVATAFTGSGLNDLAPGSVYTQLLTAVFTITIATAATPDTFNWSKTGGSGSASANGVAITGAAQTLSDGFTVTFPATTGHTVGNVWVITVSAATKEYWDSADGIKKAKWSNGTTVSMTGAGGAIGSGFDPASPGNIGGTTPAAITGTTITANTAFTTTGSITANSGAGSVLLRGWAGDANYGALYLKQAAPDSVNYTLLGDSGNTTYLNGAVINLMVLGGLRAIVNTNGLTLSLGKGLTVLTGSNAKQGTATLSGGTVTVSTTAVTANSKIYLTSRGDGTFANIVTPLLGTITAATSFVINSGNILDNSSIQWLIVEGA